MLLAAACAAVYNVFSRPYISRSGPLSVASMGMSAGALFLAPWAVAATMASGTPGLSAQGWLGVAALGTVGGALGFSLWTWALGRISPTRVAVFITLNPATAALLGLLVLGESPGVAFLPGLVVVGLGIALVSRKTGLTLARPEPLPRGFSK
jgi:drug/metabolite transporter (DMT)-like permease